MTNRQIYQSVPALVSGNFVCQKLNIPKRAKETDDQHGYEANMKNTGEQPDEAAGGSRSKAGIVE